MNHPAFYTFLTAGPAPLWGISFYVAHPVRNISQWDQVFVDQVRSKKGTTTVVWCRAKFPVHNTDIRNVWESQTSNSMLDFEGMRHGQSANLRYFARSFNYADLIISPIANTNPTYTITINYGLSTAHSCIYIYMYIYMHSTMHIWKSVNMCKVFYAYI